MMKGIMRLREFKQEDAKIIAGWLRTEEELYRWSADRFNKYPLSGVCPEGMRDAHRNLDLYRHGDRIMCQ